PPGAGRGGTSSASGTPRLSCAACGCSRLAPWRSLSPALRPSPATLCWPRNGATRVRTRPLGPQDPLRTGPKDTVTVVRARFAETDQMGVVHHSVYPVWFEAGRVERMRVRGLSYREMEATGLSLAVSRLEVAYRSAALFDDEIDVRSTLTTARSRRLAFAYRLVRLADERLVATGVTEHVPTDRSGRAVRLPERWWGPLGLP